MNIYVGNLPHASTQEALEQAFAQFGTVKSTKIIYDRETGQSRGFGFVDMPNDEEAQAAIAKMNGAEFEGRPLRVNEAREGERPARPRFGDRDGGNRRPGGFGGGRNRF